MDADHFPHCLFQFFPHQTVKLFLYQPTSSDHLYIDYNNYLHLYTRFSPTEHRFLASVASSTTKLLLLSECRESAMIAVDGPASISKIPLQLERRLRAAGQSKCSSIKRLLSIPAAFLRPGRCS